MRKILLSVTAAMLLTACSVTAPVRGSMEDGSETFAGTATGYADATGTMSISSNRGLSCVGSLAYVNARQGTGTFNCSDGRSGPFQFTGNGQRGHGVGRLGNQRFTFTFG